jgi:hypothetical protein
MKLLIYWCIANFIADFIGVECRSPSVTNNLYRNRPSTTISSPTEETSQQQFSTTTPPSLSTVATEKSNDQLLTPPVTQSAAPASVKVIPAIVIAPLNSTFPNKTLSSHLNSTKVPITAVPIIDSTPGIRINKTANVTNVSIKHGVNSRFRLNVTYVSRVTVTRPTNASQMFPKRTLLSPTMSRYLAIAKEKALNSTPSSTLPGADKPTHIIAKRAITMPLLSLDDFVLDVDNT